MEGIIHFKAINKEKTLANGRGTTVSSLFRSVCLFMFIALKSEQLLLLALYRRLSASSLGSRIMDIAIGD